MKAVSLDRYPTLSAPIQWGSVTSRFSLTDAPADERLVSNISVIPFAARRCVMIQLEDGRWQLPGGTLEQGEHYEAALRREMLEEVGGELTAYRIFGQFDCYNAADRPYRPYIPHPRFVRLVGIGEVKLIGKPLNPPDGEQVVRVETMEIGEAAAAFRSIGRNDLAELYLLAGDILAAADLSR
jgi:ADP-ribose pyrophosphatase YjhB (NUDIX family)